MATVRPEITGRNEATTDADTGSPSLDAPDWIELQRVIDLKEAARLSGLSVDSIKRHHHEKIIELSPRRRGMRLRDALSLAV